MGLSQNKNNINSSNKSINTISNNEIKDQLGDISQGIPWFEGLPTIEYKDQDSTWGNISKGIFSPHNTKWKMYIMNTLARHESEAAYSERKKLKINKTIEKIDAIIGKSIIAFSDSLHRSRKEQSLHRVSQGRCCR